MSQANAASPQSVGDLPAGAEAVLAALPSAWVVLDAKGRVVRSSPSALPYGLVSRRKLRVATLLVLSRQVRRDRQVRELTLEIPRSHRGTELVSLDVTVAPLGDQVLVLAEDRTAVRRLDAVRRDFVANVSHELKTPVGALALLAEAVLGSADDPDVGASVRRAHAAGVGPSHPAGPGPHRAVAAAVGRLSPFRTAGRRSTTWSPTRSTPTHLEADARQIRLKVRGQHGLSVRGDEDQLVTAVRNLHLQRDQLQPGPHAGR